MTNSSQAPEPCWPWRKKRNASSKLAGHATAVRRRNKSFGLGVAPPSASQNDNLSPVYFFFWEGDLHQKPIHFVTIAFWEGEHPNMLHFSIFGSYSFYIYIKGPPRVQHKTRHARNHGPQLVVLFQQTNWCGSLDQPGGEKIMKLPPTQVPLKLKENKPLIRTPNKKWHHLRRLTHSSEHDPNCVWSIRIRIATGLCVFFFALWHKCS